MTNKGNWFRILLTMLVFISFTTCGGGGSRIKGRDLVGVWELEDSINIPQNNYAIPSSEYFSDGTGISYVNVSDITDLHFTWQLREGNRIQIEFGDTGVSAQIVDVELSERRTLLTWYYNGRDYTGENPIIVTYRKR